MSKRVLIISFSMPPSPDIGGRRWIKFAKYLKRDGNLVKIIAAKEDLPGVSPWLNDGKELQDVITFIDSSYPKYLGIHPKTVTEKILYRASAAYAKAKSRGNYYDKSNHWESRLLSTCRKIIVVDSITNVICTIPPFRTAFILLTLKKEFPHINFIVDYRDPWTSNKTAFGFTSLSPKRFNYEKMLEEKVIKGYDKIVTVSEEMTTYFKDLLKGEASGDKFKVIPNGFDSEDFAHVLNKRTQKEQSKTIKIVFAGTFYDKSIHVFKKLLEAVQLMESKDTSKKGILQFVFVGSVPSDVKSLIESNSHSFMFVGRKSLEETYSILAGADYCSLFLTDDLNYSLSTKFYEYLALKKPIISFSKEKGANAKFIDDNQLGMGVDFVSMNEAIARLLHNHPVIEFNPKIDLHEFDVRNLAKSVESILIN